MRRGRVLWPAFCFCLLGFLHPLRAVAQSKTGPEHFRERASPPPEGLIHLDVSVTDETGLPVSGLTGKDFTLLDNNASQKIVSFEASSRATDENERLTEVVLVLDEVNLSHAQTEQAKGEVIKFLRQNGGRLAHPVSIYWFTENGLYGSLEPKTDGNALADEVAQHHLPRILWKISPDHGPQTEEERREAYWEPALRSVYSIAIERRQQPGRKALVWLGFGWPAGGRLKVKENTFVSLVELCTRIRESRLVISVVTPWSDPIETRYRPADYLAVRTAADLISSDVASAALHFALPVLALRSGGLVLDRTPNIAHGIEECVADAAAFYTLSFDPRRAAQPDEYHDLTVLLKEPGISARTSTGYYDQPVFYDQPRIPAARITVHQLEEMLDRGNQQDDSNLARELNGLELTERLSSSQLTLWRNRLHGKKSKAALTALADESAFLDPPPAEILSAPEPDVATQKEMLSRTVIYLKKVIPALPDFFATRVTVEYEQMPARKDDTWKTALDDQSLHEAVTQTAVLRYRNGEEQLDAAKTKGNPAAEKKDLNFTGVFGPILGSVLLDATQGGSKLWFSRWVQGEEGREAVFRYMVSAENPHYSVQNCCLVGGKMFRTSPNYRGELAIDPETGAILRLTMESEPGWILEPDLNPVLPVEDAAMMVEYGPVEIGGKRFMCPRRSVVSMRVRNTSTVSAWGQTVAIYAPYETLLNDITYTDYHKFGSEAHMLPGMSVVPDASPSP